VATDRLKILTDITDERDRQDAKWGVQEHHPATWQLILVEEVGETAEALLDDDRERYRKELVQVAAVAIAAIEDLDRREGVYDPFLWSTHERPTEAGVKVRP
jgi:NTP pyrophosphatase (non-canonical NTP hydrolase)